jgi:hypothetical protein
MRTQITLYDGESDWFQAVKKDIAEERDGVEPSNAEALRLLMQESRWG